MKKLLEKLNYKGQKRIVLLNADEIFSMAIRSELKGVQIDSEVDQRYPYDFMIIFVKSIADTEHYAPIALHNLLADGVLWFCYPKKTSKKYVTDLQRDNVWDALNNSGFYGIKMVAVDEDWSALRFRNVKFIKSGTGRFKIKDKE